MFAGTTAPSEVTRLLSPTIGFSGLLSKPFGAADLHRIILEAFETLGAGMRFRQTPEEAIAGHTSSSSAGIALPLGKSGRTSAGLPSDSVDTVPYASHALSSGNIIAARRTGSNRSDDAADGAAVPAAPFPTTAAHNGGTGSSSSNGGGAGGGGGAPRSRRGSGGRPSGRSGSDGSRGTALTNVTITFPRNTRSSEDVSPTASNTLRNAGGDVLSREAVLVEPVAATNGVGTGGGGGEMDSPA